MTQQIKCSQNAFIFLPTFETINSQAKKLQLLSIVDFTIRSLLLQHQLSQFIIQHIDTLPKYGQKTLYVCRST